jgi:hypothetical protein
MAKIVLRMSDEQRTRLEAYRAANGLRSLNAAMLHLIDTRGGTVKPYMSGITMTPEQVAAMSRVPDSVLMTVAKGASSVQPRDAFNANRIVGDDVVSFGDQTITRGTPDPATWKTTHIKAGAVQLGPTPSPAGSRLKSPKGSWKS